MKLTIIGGAGVRTPRLIPALVRRAQRLDLTELWLMDTDSDKLDVMGALVKQMAQDHNAPFDVRLSKNAGHALRDAKHIITAIRPGAERGRALDERICFEHGVLGQETTGAGGLAMAMRSVPPLLNYAQLVAAVAERDAYIYNFTNPAGLVAQALHDAGVKRIIGICDSANKAQHAVSSFLNIPTERVKHTVYGLNHLSWTQSVRVDAAPDGSGGEEVFPALLHDADFINQTHLPMFAPGLRQWQQAFLNEYLHYYYHRDEALNALLAKDETRGEEVMRLTDDLLARLRTAANPAQGLDIYHEVMAARNQTYMAHARGDQAPPETGEDEEGYAHVALGCVEAIETHTRHYTGLNVPNEGAIAGMADDDVVEVSCWVDGDGVRPVQVGKIPEAQYLLMRDVKQYERLAARAILQRDRALAAQALAVHPLVGSYPLAEKLVNAFLDAHKDSVGTWR